MLRDLQNRGLGAPARHALIFWRHGRTSTRLCDISGADPAVPAHALVVFLPDDDDGTTPQRRTCRQKRRMRRSKPASPPTTIAQPRIIRDDSETLKEIARRIREGQRQTATPAEADQSRQSEDTVSTQRPRPRSSQSRAAHSTRRLSRCRPTQSVASVASDNSDRRRCSNRRPAIHSGISPAPSANAGHIQLHRA